MVKPHKITSAVWGPFDQYVITGHEDGSVSQFDIIHVRILLRTLAFELVFIVHLYIE